MGFISSALKGFVSSLPIVGDVMSQESRSQSSAQEYERQKEFAQNGIRWKVADAKAAGIHPIFAIGANTPTYSPQAAVGTDYGLSQIGQNIGRAIEAGQTRYERAQANALQARMGDAQIGLIDAQTDYYRALAAKASPVDETLDSIGRAAMGSNIALRSQSDQRSKPIPTTQSLGRSVGRTNAGVDVLRLGNLFFEVPPQENGDALTENDAIMAAYWAAKEYGSNLTESQVLDSLTEGERKDVLSGLAYLERIPGFGFLLTPTEKGKVSYSSNGNKASGKITHFSHYVTPRKFRFGNHVLSIGPDGISYD